MNFPGWLDDALCVLPETTCARCRRPVLEADVRDRRRGPCRCGVPAVREYLPEVAVEGDGPTVSWVPVSSANVEFRADGQGGVVIYRRSKTTRRMVPGRRIPGWTEAP